MPFLLLLSLLIAVMILPQWWIQHVLARHHRRPEDNFPGTGGEFARHLLDRFGLDEVKVEATDKGDHYDPEARAVRLTGDKLDGKTLTSITVAAHETGHALQHAGGDPLFLWRLRLAGLAQWAARIGGVLLYGAPLIALLTRAPSAGLISAIGAFLMMGVGVIVQLVTLPVELDASFNKALPLLKAGYLTQEQHKGAEQVLKAAAWTYVAAALASLLNVWRWLRLLRR